MMKTADARQGPRLAWFGRAWLNRPTRRRRLLQADVRAVFLVIGDIFAPQSPEVLIVEWDYVIKHFTAKTADPALRHSSTLVSVKPDTRRMSCEIATNTMVRRHTVVRSVLRLVSMVPVNKNGSSAGVRGRRLPVTWL